MVIGTKEFLDLVLPPLEDNEVYFALGISNTGAIKTSAANSTDELIQCGQTFDTASLNAFFALAKFTDATQGRKAANASSLKSLFLDIDCGEGKPYATAEDGLIALKQFCKNCKLPKPTIIKSGRGLHVYWAFETPLERRIWKNYAEALNKLCKNNNLEIDPSVTTDAARVLRLPGTRHLKVISNPLSVDILMLGQTLTKDELDTHFAPEEDALAVLKNNKYRHRTDAMTRALAGSSEYYFKNIFVKSLQGKGCNQIKYIYEHQADISEPLWRGGLSIAYNCEDREKAIHKISNKHPEYSAEATQRKAEMTEGKPYSCDKFREINPELCEGCSFKFSNPIKLGREVVAAEEEVEVQGALADTDAEVINTYKIPRYPEPYFRGKNGGIFGTFTDKDGEEYHDVIYPHDFYAVSRMVDPDMGEGMLVRLHLPRDGVREFIIPVSVIQAKDRLMNLTGSKGILILGKKQEKFMDYLKAWLDHLQATMPAANARTQFGWTKGNQSFVVGDCEYTAEEVRYNPPSTPTAPVMPYFDKKGNLDEWKKIINAYGRPGMEYRAFAFFVGFGSILTPFLQDSLKGFVVNLVNRKSGTGKTTILRAINSIYGDPDALLLNTKDTQNFREQRLGIMQNLAVTMDEITDLDNEYASSFIYNITSGKGKGRLQGQVNAERTNHTTWALGCVTSANQTLMDKLLAIKAFPEAELQRILEISVPVEDQEEANWARAHFAKLKQHHGVAIEPYIKYVIKEVPHIPDLLSGIQARIDKDAHAKGTERFWTGIATLVIGGAILSKRAGLHDIDVDAVYKYAIELIKGARQRSRESLFDVTEYLGSFLQRHYHETLVINGKKDVRNGLDFAPIREPRGALLVRYEPDTKMLFVSVQAFRKDCSQQKINYDEALQPYKESGALVKVSNKRMTAGTVASTQAPDRALWFDTTKLDFFSEEAVINERDESTAPHTLG